MLIKQSIKESQKVWNLGLNKKKQHVKIKKQIILLIALIDLKYVVGNSQFCTENVKAIRQASNRQLETKYNPVTSMNIDATTIASINKTIQTDNTCAFNSLIFSNCCFSNK